MNEFCEFKWSNYQEITQACWFWLRFFWCSSSSCSQLLRRYALEVPVFFPYKMTNSATRGRKHYNFKTTKVETWILWFRWGTYGLFFCANFGGNQSHDTGFLARNWNPVGGSNNSRSKTNCSRRIKVSNLEPPGIQFQLSNLNYYDSGTFFSLLRTFLLEANTPKPPNLDVW